MQLIFEILYYIIFYIKNIAFYGVFMKILVVDEKYNNKKLDKFIFDKFPSLSSGLFYKTLRKKDFRVNNIRISENIALHTGDEIKVFISDELLENNISLSVIYEDNNILIINKPINMEVTNESNSATSILGKKYSYIKPCHRLDRNTSGLVLFAKNEPSLNFILDAFKNHEIEKHYMATVYGIPKVKKARLTAYLFKDSKKSLVYISNEPKKGYVKIITSYTVVKEDKKKNTCILDINLETGRTHQIRAHLAYIGFPIIGDGKYGKNEINKKFNQKTQLLECYSLKFNLKNDNNILQYLNGKTFLIS